MSKVEQNGYLADSWIDPRVEPRNSHIAGLGIFAQASIREGEVVIIWGGTVFTEEEVKMGKMNDDTSVEIGEGLYIATPFGEIDNGLDQLMNHSCDPNLWMKDEVTLIARRNIARGEEVTADYAMWIVDSWTDRPDDLPISCNCGSNLCRGVITDRDWQLPELQSRYQGHFSPYINERIRKMHSLTL